MNDILELELIRTLMLLNSEKLNHFLDAEEYNNRICLDLEITYLSTAVGIFYRN